MIRAYVYTKASGKLREEKDIDSIAREMKSPKSMVWADFTEPTVAELALLEEKFGLHHLAVEDIVHGQQRSKVEAYDNYVFIVAHGWGPEDKGEQANVFLGKTFLVTVNMKGMPGVTQAFDKIKRNPDMIKRGHDYLAYVVLDALTDSYMPEIDELEEKLDAAEDKIFNEQLDKKLLEDLFMLKREIIAIRRLVLPMRDILNILSRRDFAFVTAQNAVYYRDVYDHLVRVAELTDTQRDLLSSAMEGYLSVVSNNLNVAMKKLAAITVILMLPTLVTSFYGMNVVNLPLANYELSPELITAIIVLIGVGSYAAFHKMDWI